MTFACRPTVSSQRSTESGWRRSRRFASRTVGSTSRWAAQAAARPDRSLSAKDKMTMSPGDWRRSTASTRSSMDAEVDASRCIPSPQQRSRYAVAIEPPQTDDDKLTLPLLRGSPGMIVVMADARTDGLYEQAHRLASDRDKSLHAQNARIRGRSRNASREARRIGNLRQRQDEAFKIVMIVLQLRVMARAAIGDVVFRPDAQPKQCRRINLAVGHRHNLYGARQRPHDRGDCLLGPDGVQQVALVEHHEIGAGDLIVEHLLDWIVMIERSVGCALARERIKIGGEAPLGQRSAVDHGDDSVDRDPTLDRRPVKGLDQRLRQCQARRLDHDMLDQGFSRQDRIQRGYEVVGDRAAEATVGQFDDVLWRTRLIAATPENFAVDADVANSFTITANRRPFAWAKTCRISVVFPAPRKPVTMVHGTRADELLIRLPRS